MGYVIFFALWLSDPGAARSVGTAGLLVALPGVLSGLGQWLVLRRHVSRAAWWVMASAVGGIAGYPVGLFVAVLVLVAFFGHVG